jgi:hypothetical protein
MSRRHDRSPFISHPPGWRTVVVEAVVIASLVSVGSLAVNALRSDPLPLVARVPYQTLVPCPEPGGPVEPIAVDHPAVASSRSFVIDARSRSEFDAYHLPGAVSIPYDWLDPLPDEVMAALARDIAASGATRVVVYGDGGRPDSGEHLGREISGRGIKNVVFIEGGAPVVRGAGGGP